MLKHRFYGASHDGTPTEKSNVTVTITTAPTIESIEVENEIIPSTKGQLIMDIDKTDRTIFFKDGVRKIDFVLVIEDVKKKSQPSEVTESTNLFDGDEDATSKLRKQQRIEVWRQRFMGRIISQGLEVEEEVCDQQENILRFIKLHGPWKLLCQYAEELNIEVPLQEIPQSEEACANGSEAYLAKLCLPNIMQQQVPNQPKKYYTTPI